MNVHPGPVMLCINEVAEVLACMDLSAEYEYKLRKDILNEPGTLAEMQKLKKKVLDGNMAAEVVNEQLWHGGWARFGTEDLTVRKKVPTTMFAVRRLMWFGLGKEDEPVDRVLDYLEELFDGRIAPPEGGEVNERWPEVLKIRCAYFISMIDPWSPCLDSLLLRWRNIAQSTFHGGKFDYDVCREMQGMLLGIRGPRLIPIPLQILVCRPGFLPEQLEESLMHYCWQRHLEGFLLWPEGKLNSLPESFQNKKTSRFMNTMESMACFSNSSAVLTPAIDWLLGGREEDGLWDYGPQAKDPGGYPRRLAAMDWKKPMSRKLDCTMEVLMILKQYIMSNR